MNAFVRLPDVPGALAGFLDMLAQHDANIIEVSHVRQGVDLHSRETGVLVVIELRDQGHRSRLLQAASERGFMINEFHYP
jgi:threonine dehydratase